MVPLSVASVVAAVLVVSVSPTFGAKTIEVTGLSHLSRHQVLRLAGIGPGTNVLWLDEAGAESRLEQQLWIASARVSTSLPSTVRISITERFPVGDVRQEGRWLLVAGDGTVLADRSHDPGLPQLSTGTSVSLDEANGDLRSAASVLRPLRPWVAAKVDRVTARADGSVVLRLASGLEVLYGPPSEARLKGQSLAGILRWAGHTDERLAYVDLRSPLAPAAGLWSAADVVAPATSGGGETTFSPVDRGF